MKNILKNVSIILLLFLIIIKRPLVFNAIIGATHIWFMNIFPALFPFLIISDLIISTSLINNMTKLLGPFFTYWFGVSKYASYVFIMSLISGCPSNAKYLKDLLDNKLIAPDEAVKVLAMSMHYNPLLILGVATYLTKGDTYFILSSNIAINLIIGLINRRVPCYYQNERVLIPKKFNIIDSLSKTIDTLLLVLGSLVLFIALSALVGYEHPLILGVFELTNGLKETALLINYHYQLIFTGIILAFGGLSIQTQIKSILKGYEIEYSLFYRARIIHLGLFLLLIYLRICFFN